MKNFVVVVDTQYDFMMPDGILYVPGAEETIVPIIQYLSELKRETTYGVLFTNDCHTRFDYYESAESKQFPIHCEVGTKGYINIINVEVLDDGIKRLSLEKDEFDMWGFEGNYTINETDLFGSSLDNVDGPVKYFFDEDFQEQTDVEIIDIIGVALNFCVKQAVDGFVKRGFKVRLHTSMTRGIDTGKPGDLNARILFAKEIEEGKVIVVD